MRLFASLPPLKAGAARAPEWADRIQATWFCQPDGSEGRPPGPVTCSSQPDRFLQPG